MLLRLIARSKEKVRCLLQKKLTTSLLILTSIMILLSRNYYFIPYLEEKEGVKVSYIAKKMQERYEMKPEDFVFILKAFAVTNHIGVWIDSLLIENNTVTLDIRALDATSINEYINLLTKNSKLVVDGISTSYVKKISKKNIEGRGSNIPLAYARFLKMTKKPKNLDSRKKKKNTEYFYGSKIRLLRKGVL